MGLKGNLSTVSLADVFQVLSRGSSTGLLRINAVDGARFVEFQNGFISTAGRSNSQMLVGDLLLARGFIDFSKLQTAVKTQEESGLLLGQILLEMGLVTPADLESAIQFQVEEEVCELFTLTSGEFDFLANAALDARIAPAGGLVRLKLDPDSVLLEAARRSDEWKDIQQRIPDQAVIFQLTMQGTNVCQAGEGVSSEGMMMLKLVLEHLSVESIVQKACLGRLNTNRMLIELWDASLIQPLALTSYAKIAQEEIEQGKLDEAERVTRYALRLISDPDSRKRLEGVIEEIEKKRRKSVEIPPTDLARTESLKKIQPNIILKKERSIWPFAVAAVLLIGIGVGFLQYQSSHQSSTTPERREYEERVAKSIDLMQARKFVETLKLWTDFKPGDTEVKELVTGKINDIKAEIGSELLRAINEFRKAKIARNLDELKKAVEKLDDFEGIEGLQDNVQASYKEIKPEIEALKLNQIVGKFRERLEKLKEDAKTKGSDFLLQGYHDLLKDDPPEEAAAAIRDEQSVLTHAKAEAVRKLERAKQLAKISDFEGARTLIEAAKLKYPNSGTSADADKYAGELQQQLADASNRFGKIEILVNQRKLEEAKTAAMDLVKSNPPWEVRTKTYELLHRILPDSEPEAQQMLRDSQQASARGRQRALELVEKFPYSKSALRAMLRVDVNTIPEGAEVSVNGMSIGKTPAVAEVPALGLARIQFKLDGYQPQEFVESNYRGEREVFFLERNAALSRRLPFVARAGVVANANEIIAAGEFEIAHCARLDLGLKRLKVPEVKADAASPEHKPVSYRFATVSGRDCALTTSERFVIAWNFVTNKYTKLNLEEPATAPAVIFAPAHLQGKTFVGAATRMGYELFERDGKLVKRNQIHGDKRNPPDGASFDRESNIFFIPGVDNNLYAITAFSGDEIWKVPCGDKIISSPASNHSVNAVAVIVARKLLIFDTDQMKERGHRDLAASVRPECAAAGEGFVTITLDGKVELISGNTAQPVWSASVNGQPGIPVAVSQRGEKELSRDQTVIGVCSSSGSDHFVTTFSAASGKIFWRARLDAAPVSVAIDGNSVIVATDDGQLTVFSVK